MLEKGFIEQSLCLRRGLRRFLLGWLHPKTIEAEDERASLNQTLNAHWQPHSIKAYELLFESWESDISTGVSRIKEGSYLVFIDFEFDVDWIAEIDIQPPSAKCISTAEAIGARRCSHLPHEQVLELKRLVGQAIISGIRNDEGQCSSSVAAASQFLKDRTIERSRYWTLISAHSFFFLLSALLVFCFFGLKNWEINPIFWSNLLAFSIQGGLLGAYLSIIHNAGNGQWDAAAGKTLHALEVMTKLATGALFGGIVFVIGRSLQAPPALKELVSDAYSVFILGLAAGFIERLVPKMVSSYSEAALGK